jgi:hypothetical protein
MKVIENKSGVSTQAEAYEAGNWAHPIPGADPGPPTNGGSMRGKGEPGFPLHPLGGGAIPWASACDFLGSPCPRRQTQGWLEGDVDAEEVYYEDDEAFEVDENDEFAELVEYFDNQWW